MSDYVKVDELGRVGLAADPDALLTVAPGALTLPAGYIESLSPYAWYDAADLVGTPERGAVKIWIDRIAARNLGGDPGSQMTFCTGTQPTQGDGSPYNTFLPGSLSGAYLSWRILSGPLWNGQGSLAANSRSMALTLGYASTICAWSCGAGGTALGGYDSGIDREPYFEFAWNSGAYLQIAYRGRHDGAQPPNREAYRVLPTRTQLQTYNWAFNAITKNAFNESCVSYLNLSAVAAPIQYPGNSRFLPTNFFGMFNVAFNGGFPIYGTNHVAELIVFDYSLTPAQIAGVRQYMALKYKSSGLITTNDLLSISSTPVASADYVNVTSVGTVGLSTQPSTPVTPTAQLQLAQRATPLDFLKVEDNEIPEPTADHVHVDHEGLVGLSKTSDGTTLLQMQARATPQDFLTLKDTV